MALKLTSFSCKILVSWLLSLLSSVNFDIVTPDCKGSKNLIINLIKSVDISMKVESHNNKHPSHFIRLGNPYAPLLHYQCYIQSVDKHFHIGFRLQGCLELSDIICHKPTSHSYMYKKTFFAGSFVAFPNSNFYFVKYIVSELKRHAYNFFFDTTCIQFNHMKTKEKWCR
jgi:hypothetical protein